MTWKILIKKLKIKSRSLRGLLRKNENSLYKFRN